MLTLTGEVRKILDKSYVNRNGDTVSQAVVVMEPEHDSRNYEVYLSTKQVSSGIKDQWEKLKGSKASVIVSLFVNYEYKFHKFNAVGNAKPLEVAS